MTGAAPEPAPGRRGFLEAGGHRLEYACWAAARVDPQAPTLVLLHEGLGCVALWKDFPAQLRAATGLAVLAYSRYGYGGSDPLAEARAADFMHREATGALPQVLARLGIGRAILVGHSDGASIALIHAGRFAHAGTAARGGPGAGAAASGPAIAGVVALAPHLFVEPVCIQAIAAVSAQFAGSDLAARLGRYHRDPVSAFRGWADVWRSPAFQAFDIEPEVAAIGCPILAIQGEDDAYGTMRQIDQIAALRPGTRLLKLAHCGHSPHLDRADEVTAAIAAFAAAIG